MGRPRRYTNNGTKQRAYRQRKRLQVPTVHIGAHVTLYQGDALQIAPGLKGVGALITDPPYGTHFDFTKPRRSTRPLQPGPPHARWRTNIPGDGEPFDPTPWLTYPQVILWGAQHYASRLPESPAWLLWDKRDGATSDHHADAELAWTNLPGVTRLFTHKWRGMIRAGEENLAHGPKLHPAQKPVALMAWCVAMTRGLICDPYMGSGTTGLACVRLQRPFIGIEIDPAAFAVAVQRLSAACAR